ncbi:MAG: DNA polymerase III subunit epsilon [Pseudomonadota bacterium]
MREIVWDTETTGFDPDGGDRLVEIGAVELQNHMPTGRIFHQYINPERDMPQGAFEVHGLSEEFLKDYPVFKKIGQAFLDFVGDAVLIAHNANFDMKFINAELKWATLPQFTSNRALDTLEIARRKFPGAQNSLDALCRRFGVDNSGREKHGALLDSELLAEVYLELIGGRQPDLTLDIVAGSDVATKQANDVVIEARANPLPARLTDEERGAHQKFVESFGADGPWKGYR